MQGLFSDAEAAEYFTEQVVGRQLPGYFAEGALGVAQMLCEQFYGSVVIQAEQSLAEGVTGSGYGVEMTPS